MIVRKMTTSDVEAVVNIEKECFSLPWSKESFLDSLQREDTIFLVCETEADLVVAGYIGMYLSFDEASITNVAVSPQFRKQGVGKALVEQAKLDAKESGAATLFLEVRVSNVPAISLYKQAGFESLGVRKKFYEHPVEDAYVMSVSL